MEYRCHKCGTPLPSTFFGIYCNSCLQIEAIDRQTEAIRTQALLNGRGGSSGGDFGYGPPPLPEWVYTTLFCVFLFSDYMFLNFAVCKFIWAFLKVGAYMMLLGYFWADPSDFGI